MEPSLGSTDTIRDQGQQKACKYQIKERIKIIPITEAEIKVKYIP